MSSITTHVQDLSLGRPARGVAVTLGLRSETGAWSHVARSVTDPNGRCHDLLPADQPLRPGIYCLKFASGDYFQARGVSCFYPEVLVTFQVAEGKEPCQILLLLGPHSYTTSRGV